LRIGSYATFSKVDVFGALSNISISCALSPGWILLFTCQLAVVLVHIFPAEHFFSSCFDELFAVYVSLSSLFVEKRNSGFVPAYDSMESL